MYQEIRAFHGDTIPLNLSGVVGFDGVAVTDLAGWTVVFAVKSCATSSMALVVKTTADNSVTIDEGQAWTEISAAESAALFSPGRTYFFSAQVTDPQARVATPITGSLIILNPPAA